MTECQHWHDPEIVERERSEKELEIMALHQRIGALESKLRQIRDLTADISLGQRTDFYALFEQQRLQAMARSQRQAIMCPLCDNEMLDCEQIGLVTACGAVGLAHAECIARYAK